MSCYFKEFPVGSLLGPPYFKEYPGGSIVTKSDVPPNVVIASSHEMHETPRPLFTVHPTPSEVDSQSLTLQRQETSLTSSRGSNDYYGKW